MERDIIFFISKLAMVNLRDENASEIKAKQNENQVDNLQVTENERTIKQNSDAEIHLFDEKSENLINRQ